MELQVARIGLLLILLSITLFGIIILILKSLTSQTAQSLEGFRTYPNVIDPNVNMYLKAMPANVYNGGQSVSVIAAVVALVIGYIATGLTIWAWPKTRMQKKSHRLPWSLFLGINTIFSSAALVYVFAINGQSAHFHAEYRDASTMVELATGLKVGGTYGKNGSYAIGTFDYETWFCSLAKANLPGAKFQQQRLEKICTMEAYSRWLLIPLTILTALAIFFALYGMANTKEEDFQEQEQELRERPPFFKAPPPTPPSMEK